MNNLLKLFGISLLISSTLFASAAKEDVTRQQPAIIAKLAATDTELALQSMQDGDTMPYVRFVGEQIKAKASAYIDSLVAADGAFLNGTVAIGGTDKPADRTRDAFKVALNTLLDTTVATRGASFAPPANARISSLALFDTHVQQAFMESLHTYIDSLLPAEGVFLDPANLKISSAGGSEHMKRNAFRDALIMHALSY